MARRTFSRRPRAGGVKRVRGGWWPARTTDTPENPQRCGLSGRPLIGTDTVPEEQASRCFFLTVRKNAALPVDAVLLDRARARQAQGLPIPEGQIETSGKDEGYPTGYRAVPSGEFAETIGTNGRVYRRALFKYQQRNGDEWHDVDCWSHAVIAEEAETRGFKVPGGLCNSGGLKGDRTEGHEHRVAVQPETPLAALAHALDDEVSPEPVPVDETPAPAPAPAPAPEAGAERFRGLELD